MIMRFVCAEPDCRSCIPGDYRIWDSGMPDVVWVEPGHVRLDVRPHNTTTIMDYMRAGGFAPMDPWTQVPEGL